MMVPGSISCWESLPATFQTAPTPFSLRCRGLPSRSYCIVVCNCNASHHDGGDDDVSPPPSSSFPHQYGGPNPNSSIFIPPTASRRSFLSLVTVGVSLTSPLSISINSRNDATILELEQMPLHQPSMVMLSASSFAANAAETIGKDESCNDASCLGVWDGLLADCPHDKRSNSIFGGSGGAGCVASQDDTPGIFAEPWDYSENIPLLSSTTTETSLGTITSDEDSTMYKQQMDRLILALESISRQHADEMQVLYQEGRYIRVLFTDGSSGEKSVGEFYFTPHDTTVQFRLGSTTTTSSSSMGGVTSMLGGSLSNMERSERLRKALRYLKVPVLRNRKRTLFFVESELDGFGPGSAALGPPEEMSTGELNGGR